MMCNYEIWRDQGAYGMLCKELQDGSWHTAAVVAPFTASWEAAARLVGYCSVLQPSPERLADVAAAFVFRTVRERSGLL